MKRDSQQRIPDTEQVSRKKDPHEVFSDGVHHVVTRITPENLSRVLSVSQYDRSQSAPYVFFSQFAGSRKVRPDVFYGQASRHVAFETAIREQTGAQELQFRGQLQVDQKKGKFHIFSFFDMRDTKHFSGLSPRELRTTMRKILSKIDQSLLSDQVIILLNSNTYYIYFSRAKILKRMKNASIGTMRYD